MQVMLLGFVLLGRSLEERARVKASSDMNELLVSFNDSKTIKHYNAYIYWVYTLVKCHTTCFRVPGKFYSCCRRIFQPVIILRIAMTKLHLINWDVPKFRKCLSIKLDDMTLGN